MRKNKLYTFSVALLATFSFSSASFASDIEIDGIYYSFDEKAHTAEVTYKGKCRCGGDVYQGAVVIPSSVSYEGSMYAVTSIGEYAFSSNLRLESVVVPQSVRSIGYFAFAGCRSLVEVRFCQPSSLRSIDSMAFLACKSLPAIEIPQSVEKIGSYAFEMCNALTDVAFDEPSQLKEIENYVFCYTGLDHLAIPASVERISDVAFCSNPNLVDVVLPKTITSISPRNPFCYNTQTTSMKVEEGNPVYDSRNNCNAIIETATNTLIAGCKTTLIPASVTALGRSCFNHCTDLIDANLPATIRSIGKYAYLGCTGLKSFYFPSTMNMMADSVFWQAANLDSVVSMTQRPFAIDESDFDPAVYQKATLFVPAGTKSIYRSAPVWTKFQNIVEMDRFVVDGVSYRVVAEGDAVVVAASEGVPYSGTVVVPQNVKSGTASFRVVGVDDKAFIQKEGGNSEVKIIMLAELDNAASNIHIYGNKGFIKIEGTDAEAFIYSPNGTLMRVTTERVIPVEQGVYMVSVAGRTVLVPVK